MYVHQNIVKHRLHVCLVLAGPVQIRGLGDQDGVPVSGAVLLVGDLGGVSDPHNLDAGVAPVAVTPVIEVQQLTPLLVGVKQCAHVGLCR